MKVCKGGKERMVSLGFGSFSKKMYDFYSDSKKSFESYWNRPALKKLEGSLSFSFIEEGLTRADILHPGAKKNIENLIYRLNLRFEALDRDFQQIKIGASSYDPEPLKKLVETSCRLLNEVQDKAVEDPYLQASLLNAFNKIVGYVLLFQEHLDAEMGESKLQLHELLKMKKQGYEDPIILNFLALEATHLRDLAHKSEAFQVLLERLFKTIDQASVKDRQAQKNWEELKSKLLVPRSDYQKLNQEQIKALLIETETVIQESFLKESRPILSLIFKDLGEVKTLSSFHKKSALLYLLSEPLILQAIQEKDTQLSDQLEGLVQEADKVHYKLSKKAWKSKIAQRPSVKIKDLPLDDPPKKIGAFYHYSQNSQESFLESYALYWIQELVKSPDLLEETISKIQAEPWGLSTDLSIKMRELLANIRSNPDQIYERLDQGSMIKDCRLFLQQVLKEKNKGPVSEQLTSLNHELGINTELCSSKILDPSSLQKGSFLLLDGKQYVLVNLPRSFNFFNPEVASNRKADELFEVVTKRKKILTTKMKSIASQKTSVLNQIKKNGKYLSLFLLAGAAFIGYRHFLRNEELNSDDCHPLMPGDKLNEDHFNRYHCSSQNSTSSLLTILDGESNLGNYPSLRLNTESQTVLDRNIFFRDKVYEPKSNIDSCSIENILASSLSVSEERRKNNEWLGEIESSILPEFVYQLPSDSVESNSCLSEDYLVEKGKELKKYASVLCRTKIDPENFGFYAVRDLDRALNQNERGFLDWDRLEKIDQSLSIMGASLHEAKYHVPEGFENQELQWKVHVEGAQEEVRQLQSKLNETKLLMFRSGPDSILETQENNQKTENSRERTFIETIKEETKGFISSQASEDQDRLVLHVLLDGLGVKSGLEGAPRGFMAEYLQSLLSTTLLDEEFQKDDSELHNKATLIANLNRHHKFEELRKSDLNEFIDLMRKELGQLGNGQTLLLEGGWANTQDGHAMLYEIIKSGPNKFKFRIYNTGSGIENHKEYQLMNNDWILPIKEFDNINIETLTSYSFWLAFNQLLDNRNDLWESSFIYNDFMEVLDGSVSIDSHSIINLFPPQISGTCSHRVLMAYLYGLFKDKNQFHRAEFKIKVQTLLEYMQNTPFESFVHDERKRNLIEKAIAYFSRDLIKLQNLRIISNKEFEEVSRYIIKLGADISVSKMEATKRYSDLFAAIDLDPQSDVQTQNYYRMGIADTKEHISNSSDDKPYFTEFIPSFSLRESDFAQDFNLVFDHIKNLYSNDEIITALSSVREMTSRLRLSDCSKDNHVNIAKIISKFSLEEAEAFAYKLREISLIHFKSLHKDDRRTIHINYPIDPSIVLSQIKLSLLSHLTMNRFLELRSLTKQNFIINAFEEMIEGKNIYMLLYDPLEDKELEEVREFLGKNKVESKSFFDFKDIKGVNKKGFNFKEFSLSNWDYLKTKEFQDNFIRVHSEPFESMTWVEKLRRIYADSKFSGFRHLERILPNSFFYARDVAAISHRFVGDIRDKQWGMTFDESEENTRGMIFDESEENPIGFEIFDRPRFQIFEKYIQEVDSDLKRPLHHARKEISRFSNILDQGSFGRYNAKEEEKIYCDLHKQWLQSIGNQKYREFASIKLEKDLQIVNALGHFKNELLSFKDPGMQGSFEETIFDRDILTYELTQSKIQTQTLIDQFRNFFQSGLEIHLDLNDIDTATFFVENAIRFQRYIRYIESVNPDYASSNSEVLDIPKVINSIIKHHTPSLIQKIILQANLVIYLSEVDTLTKEQLTDLFAAWISIQTKTQNESPLAPQIYSDLVLAFEKGLPRLYNLLKEVDHSLLCNEILKKVRPNFKIDLQWKEKSGFIYESTDEKIRIDLKKGLVFLEGSQIASGLDLKIQKEPIFKTLFTDHKDLTILSSDEYTEITTSHGSKFRVSKNLESKKFVTYDQAFICPGSNLEEVFRFEKLHEGEWYPLSQLAHKYSEYTKYIPEFFRSAPYMKAKKTEECSLKEIFFDQKTHEAKYQLVNSDILGDALSYTIQKLDSSNNHLPTHDLVDFEKPIDTCGNMCREQKLYPQVFEWLSLLRFESRDFLLIWRSIAEEKINLIELPRYDLTFNLEEQGERSRFLSKEFKGFYISKAQYLDEFESFGQYLVLENESGKKMVLLPKRILGKPSNSLTGDYPYFVEKGGDEALSLSKPYSVINLNPKGKIDFALLTKENKLQLSAVYFSQHNFEKASDLLSQCKSGAFPLSDEARFHLQEIIKLTSMNDPRALYIKLKAASLLAKNNLDYFVEINSNDLDLYIKYLTQNEGFAKYSLTRSEEESLIYSFLNDEAIQGEADKVNFLLNRLKFINEEQYEVVLSHFALSKVEPFFIQDNPVKYKYSSFDLLSDISLDIQGLFSWLSQLHEWFHREKSSLLGYHFMSYETGQSQHYGKELLVDTYRVIQDPYISLSEKITFINKHFHHKLPLEITEEEFFRELKVAFKIMLQHKEKVSLDIVFLNAVLNAPDKFPSFKDFERAKNEIERLKSYQIFGFWSANPVFQQIEQGLREFYLVDEKKSYEDEAETPALSSVVFPDSLLPKPKVELSARLPKDVVLNFGELSLEDPLVLAEFFEESNQVEVGDSVELKVNTFTDSLVRKELRIFQKGIDSYRTSSQEPLLKDLSLDDLNQMHHHFEVELQDRRLTLRKIEFDLLKLANKIPESTKDLTEYRVNLAADLTKRLSLKELKLLFLEKDLNAYKKRNPYLTESECQTLQTQIKELLVTSTYVQQLDRSKQALAQYLNSQKSTPDVLASHLKELAAALTSHRYYSIEEHPEILVFEEALGILLRRDQVESIEKLLDDSAPNTVLEMVVGAGKTYVLSPLIAKAKADGQNLSILMMPEELFPSMSREIELSLGASFQSQVQSFHFDRNTKLNSLNLYWVGKQLQDCIDQKKILMITPKSIQSFYLMFIEALLRFEKSNDKEREGYFTEIHLYKEILTLFKTKGNVLIDEIDTVLHPLKEHHFTYKSSTPNPQILHTIGDLYRTLVESFKPLIEMYSQKREEAFSEVKYHTEYKPKLVETLLNGGFTQNDPQLKAFLASNAQNREIVKDFLENRSDGTQLDSASVYIQDRLAMAKEMINSLLPLTLSKSVNEHYGLSKRDKQLTVAIPYHGSNHPAEGSRFGTFYEASLYTYQYYLDQGVSKELILSAVENLQLQFAKEFKELQNGCTAEDLKKLPSFQTFAKLSPKLDKVEYFTNIKGYIDLVQEILNEDPVATLNFIEQFIVSKMEVFDEHIKVGPQVYDWMFKRVNGFTGTLWNFEAFPEGMAAHYSTEASGKILSLLYKNSEKEVRAIANSCSLKQMLSSILGKENLDNTQAIIDVGAYFKGYSGEEVAHAILESKVLSVRQISIKGVIFYDDQGKLLVLEKMNGKTQVIEYTECSLPKEQLMTFYDQKHTTGSNIPQSKKANGILTVGPKLKVRDLIQAAGRMRQLDKEQTVSFVVQDSIYELIREQNREAVLDLNAIFGFALKNQVSEKARNNFRSFNGKLESGYEFAIIDHLLEEESIDEMKALISPFESQFVMSEKAAPYKQFHGLVEERPTTQILNNALRQFDRKVKGLSDLSISKPELSKNSTQDSFNKKHVEVLPKTLPNRNGNYEFEVETQVEQEVEQEIEIEKEESYDVRDKECRPLDVHKKFEPETACKIERNLFPVMEINQNYKEPTAPVLPLIPFEATLSFVDKKYTWFFDPNLMTTLNIVPLTVKGGSGSTKEFTIGIKPFDFEMRYPRHALIIKKEGEEKLQWVLLDEENAAIIKRSPVEQLVPEGADYKIALYHLRLDDFSKKGEDPAKALDVEQIKDDLQFVDFRVQMKFFSGDLYYTKKELEVLEAFILRRWKEKLSSEAETMDPLDLKVQAMAAAEDLFKKIISEKDYSQRYYVGSRIQKFLNPTETK